MRQIIQFSKTILVFLLLFSFVSASSPVKIIIDTDSLGDVDDFGAIAIAHALEDNNKTKILGIALSAHDYAHNNTAAISAINYYYGKSNIPISSWYEIQEKCNDKNNTTCLDNNMLQSFHYSDAAKVYATEVIQKHFSDNIKNYNRPEDSLTMYKRLLHENNASTGKIKIVVLGTYFNIKRLLEDLNSTNQMNLLIENVDEIVMGAPITKNANTVSSGSSISMARESTIYVLKNTPESIELTVMGTRMYSKFRRYDNLKIKSEYISKMHDGPVKTAYDYYNNHDNKLSIYDQAMILYSIKGEDVYLYKQKNLSLDINKSGFLETYKITDNSQYDNEEYYWNISSPGRKYSRLDFARNVNYDNYREKIELLMKEEPILPPIKHHSTTCWFPLFLDDIITLLPCHASNK